MSRKSARPSRPKEPDFVPIPVVLGALAFIVLIVFGPTLRSEFVYDSQGEIVLWDWLHEPGDLLTALTFQVMRLDVLDFNRPVAVASLMFDSLVWGRAPFGYHLTNILLHVATTWAVFFFVRHLLAQARPGQEAARRSLIAFLAALLFALHPVVTEAVCEPSNRKDILATLFGLLALLIAARHRPGWGAGDPARVLLCPLLALLAIGSKELGAAVPVILLAYWLLFRRREPAGFWMAIVAGSGLVAVLFLIARFALAHHPSEIFLTEPTYPGRTLAATLVFVQPRIFALYLVNLFWPVQLCADYNYYSVRFLPLWLSFLLLILAAMALTWWSVRDRRAFFAFAFIVATLLPVANLVPIYHAAADRFLYAPLVGFVLLVALALDSPWLAARRLRGQWATGALLLVLGLLLPLTLQRETAWSSELALWRDTLERNPTSFNARVNLPDVLLGAGRTEEALAQTRATLRTSSATWPWVWVDYAIELERTGDHAGAEQAARRAIELKPDVGDAGKMKHTLQAPSGQVEEFDQIAARLPKPTP